ncbi:hypothetical protein DN730_04885 [Marinomonas piezotolerans]|uniref:HTH tetR-type domain-containing protein n=1 Tax=Marinomonas piezotolerans TaxID=2213058 RepID=A0A370UAX4_9GAMM|nr:TetR/AcrR family transcriptional regulator [Marinomonas piezotolerans]RDL44956.1 hypothetical protein DN730_04885 [Marinomonas piezotolerans]
MDMRSTLDAPDKPMNPTKLAIMDAAEQSILKHGYKAMSFRDLAAQVGIKSASVHYHFPTKADLLQALLVRHQSTLEAAMKPPKKKRQAAQKALNQFIECYRDITISRGSMALSAVLLAEHSLLDAQSKEQLNDLYQWQCDWLATIVSYLHKAEVPTDSDRQYASQIMASLHGASILAKATQDADIFDQVTQPWRTLVDRI